MKRLALAFLALVGGPTVGPTAFAQVTHCDADGHCKTELDSESPVIPAPREVAPTPPPIPSRSLLCHTPAGICDWPRPAVRYGDPCSCQDADGQIFDGTLGPRPGRWR